MGSCFAGAMKQSADALNALLNSFAASKHYANMQHMRNHMLMSLYGKSASAAHSTPDESRGAPMQESTNSNQHLMAAGIAATESLLASDAPSQHSMQGSAHDRVPFAAAYAADWACLIWLLQTAPDVVSSALRLGWRDHQAQEFALWVRPASELSSVRSKAAAKVYTRLHTPHAPSPGWHAFQLLLLFVVIIIVIIVDCEIYYLLLYEHMYAMSDAQWQPRSHSSRHSCH